MVRLRTQLLRGSLAIAAGEVAIYACSLIRNMILARILTKSDYGLAATFGMVLTILEFSGKLAVSRLVVQDRDGGHPEFLATAHFLQVSASVLSTFLLLVSAVPITKLFGIQGHETTFFALAFLPLAKGLEHLDTARMERDLRFAPATLSSVMPHLLITVTAWPMAVWLGDYRAVLALLATKALGSIVMTHVLAEQPYRWSLNRPYLSKMLRFGWPLLLNGFLMFGVFQGDQFLVGHYYSLADLGTYSAAAALALAPSLIFGRILGSMMLPLMAQVQDDGQEFRSRYRLCIQAVSAFSVGYAVTMIVAAQAWMTLAYGSNYEDGGIILAWVAASNVFRIIRFAPSTAALAKADSQNQLYANMLRVLSLAPAGFLGWSHQPLWTLAAAGLAGESLACFYSLWRLKRRDDTPWSASLGPIALATLGIFAAGTLARWGAFLPVHLLTVLALLLGTAGCLGVICTFQALRSKVVGGFRERLAT
jgi:O-antigen/teichoic acid export membrane protein